MVYLLPDLRSSIVVGFILTLSISGAHHHAHYKHQRPRSIDLPKINKLEPIENLNINIYTPPDTPRPPLPVSVNNNTKIKVAMIGFGATVLSSALTAIIMWRTCNCS